MPTVAEFYDELRAVVRRGNTLDSSFPHALRAELGFIEQNTNLTYMKYEQTLVVPDGATSVLLTSPSNKRLKTIISVRWMDENGEWNYLKQVDPTDLASDEGTIPVAFVLTPEFTASGVNRWRMTFDCPFVEGQTLTIHSYQYTVWDGSETTADLWPLENARTLVLARAMVYLAPIMRDNQILQMYNQFWLENITALVQGDMEREQGTR